MTHAGSGANPPKVALLQEILREAERAVDHQIRAMELLDMRCERALALSVAALGGGAALTTFSLSSLPELFDQPFAAIVGVGGLLNLMAVLLLVGTYLGFRRRTEFHIAPSIGWLAVKARDGTWTLLEHYLSILGSYADYQAWNVTRTTIATDGRRRALYALASAICWYAVGLGYILVRFIGESS